MPTKTLIHVSAQAIRANLPTESQNKPPLLVLDHGGARGGRRTRHAHLVEILGPSRLVYSPTALPSGARCWIETEAPVTLT